MRWLEGGIYSAMVGVDTLTLLLVDDNEATRKMISAFAKAQGWDLIVCKDTAEALKVFQDRPISIVLMEIVNGGPGSFEATRYMKRVSRTPVIFLSSRSSEDDKLRAFDAGADDYVTKPFSWRELLARIRVNIRNARRPGDASESEVGTIYTFGDLTVDVSTRRVDRGGSPVELTPTELNLLMLFARNIGRVLTHAFILEAIWGHKYTSDRDYLRAYIYRLRRKLETDPDAAPLFITIAGAGYMFTGGIARPREGNTNVQ